MRRLLITGQPKGSGRASRSGRFLALVLISAGAAPALALPGGASPLPAQFAAPASQAPAPAIDPAWWTAFADPALGPLIARTHAQNTAIARAEADLSAARAHAGLGAASRAPFVAATASGSHAGGPLINKAGGSGNLFTAGLTASWEADLLGRLAGERRADRLDVSAAEANLAATRLLVEAAAVRGYFTVVYLQQAEVEAASLTSLIRERQAFAAARLAHGLASPADLAALRQQALASESRVAAIARDLAEARAALAFITGDMAPLPLAQTALPAPPAIAPGLPSDVLARRPDVAAALHRLEAADSRLASARRSWFPQLALTADGGAAAPGLGELLANSARSFGLNLILSIPVFDGGRRKQRIAGSAAELDRAKAQYREAMLASLHEVNTALAAIAETGQQADLAANGLAAGETFETIAAARAANGTISRAALEDARLAATERRLDALQARYARLVAAVDLVKAIGGGSALARS